MKPKLIRGFAYGMVGVLPLALHFEFGPDVIKGFLVGVLAAALYYYLMNLSNGLEE